MRFPRCLPMVFFTLVCGTSAAAALPVPEAPAAAADSYLLMDFDSGQILASSNPDIRHDPASLTKMMTAYVVYTALSSGRLALEDTPTISEKAWRMEGSRMFVEVGKQVRIADLLRGLIIQSGNDASIALAEAVAGSEGRFADAMNDHAARLGMRGSHFSNSTGLPDAQHYTTARDMAILARALIRDFPKEYELYAERDFTYNNITQYNRNKLLWRDASVDGIKTGHTDAAGYCLVASARRDGMRIISVVLGAGSDRGRIADSQRLLEYAFRYYQTRLIHTRKDVITSLRIWQGTQDYVSLGVADDVYITVPKEQMGSLKTTLEYDEDAAAPITAGQVLGSITVRSGDGQEVIIRRPLTAQFAVAEGNFLQRAVDAVLHYLQ